MSLFKSLNQYVAIEITFFFLVVQHKFELYLKLKITHRFFGGKRLPVIGFESSNFFFFFFSTFLWSVYDAERKFPREFLFELRIEFMNVCVCL